MSGPDLSGIDPTRVPEARRRIAAIEEYLALPAATTADAVRISAGIGLSRWQFHRLARAWREHRDPRVVVGGRLGPSSRDYGIDPRARAIADEEILAAGANAELAALAPRIERRCREAGVEPPSRATIWTHMRKARKGAATDPSGPARVLIGRMWFHLPVEGRPADEMPVLLAAILLPEGRIIAHRISVDASAAPSVGDLVTQVAALRTDGADPRRLDMDGDDLRAARDAIEAAGLPLVRPHHRSVQREMSQALAGELGPLRGIHRRAAARPASHRTSRRDHPVPPADALAAIAAAVEAHNTALPSPTPFDIRAG